MIQWLQRKKFILVFLLVYVSILSMIYYSMAMNDVMTDIHAPQLEASRGVELELALAHIAFEENLLDQQVDKSLVRQHLEHAHWYTHSLLVGGSNHQGSYQPLDKQMLRDEATYVLKGLSEMVNYLGKEDVKHTEVGFHQRYKEIMAHMQSIELVLLDTIQRERIEQKEINRAVLIATAFLLIIVYVFYRRSKGRERDYIQRLKSLASTDALTGIDNRRSFDETLSNEWNHALRGSYSISLAICDIDFFKKYNDTLGHQAGDMCLKRVSNILQQQLRRPVDKVARYGGEEFAFILPFTDRNGAGKVMQKLHKGLQQENIIHPSSECADYVTMSIGVCSLIPRPDISISNVIDAADEALYQAKTSGRNRTCHSRKYCDDVELSD